MRISRNSSARAMRVFPLALLMGLVIACAEFTEFEETYNGLIPTPTVASSDADKPQGAVNFLSEDFPIGWLVRASSGEGGTRQIVATDPGDKSNTVTSLVQTLESDEAAQDQLARVTAETNGIAPPKRLDIGDGAMLVQRESSIEIIFTQGAVFGRLSTRGDEESAVDWAIRLTSRIEGNPLPPPAVAPVAARTRTFTSSVRPITSAPNPAPIAPTPEPVEPAILEPAATSTESIVVEQSLELSSPASVGSSAPPPAEQMPEGIADLVLMKIEPGSNPATPGANVKWTATIFNGGVTAAEDPRLGVFVRQISTTTFTQVGELEFADVPPGGTVNIDFHRAAMANEIIEFAILPGSTLDLWDGNNHKSAVVSDIMLPDLIVESLAPSGEAVYPNQLAEWQLTVTNRGAGNFYGETEIELLGDTEGAATTTFIVTALASGESQKFIFGSIVAEETSLAARVDFAGQVTEYDDTNNTLVGVSGRSALRPNLIIESVTSIPEFPLPGDSVEWTYAVLNRGPGNSREFDLAVLASTDPDSLSSPIFQAAGNGLEVGETFAGSFKRKAVAEESLQFVVSHSGALEVSNSDNVLEFAIHERMLPDLRIASVISNRLDIESGEAFTWRIEIENIGAGDVSRITEISMIDIESGEELATSRVSPVARGETTTVSLDVGSAIGRELRFVADSTLKVKEADEENNSLEISVLDVMAHDIRLVSLTTSAPVDFIEITAFRWVIANDGPGRALNLNAHVTIFHAGGGSTSLPVAVISSLEAGSFTTGVTKYLPVAGDRVTVVIETPEQFEVNELDNTAEFLVDDLQT
ncbi:MAG: hypothetical protein HQ478_12280 [Chloroflexi bacterium]|nr:hypothetical protein [Chloroflexota bacterium]